MRKGTTPLTEDSLPRRVKEIAALFLKLGITAFGGPAAHIGMMHNEVVKRRRWLGDQEFLDLVGATNLIPGPNSTEMAIHIGFLRAGWLGLITGGACFILPAMVIVMGLAWVYVRFGTTVQASWLLYGVKPVVIAIIVQALWSLGPKAIKSAPTAAVGLIVFILYFFGVNEIALLFAGGFAVMIGVNLRRLKKRWMGVFVIPFAGLGLPAVASLPFSLPILFLTFLKIGAVLYGSGYVLLAFLRADFVVRLGWLTDRQLMDAIAIGQVTPGPVFTTATFIGYLLGGAPGSLLATLGIFLPSFVFVAISHPLIPRLRKSTWASGFLDGVNAASLGLMAAVTWNLGRASLIDPVTGGIAIISIVFLIRFKMNSTWFIILGAIIGLLRMLFVPS
ncbi:MAG: chromate transporter [Deltaproteobacteria bacterium RBG_16_50_11]|nr:MAG: chromate transporter [Deltaproteobacteria bacterium RBG_16_50_11]